MKFQILLLFATLLLASGKETKKPEDVEKGEKLIQSVLKAIELKDKKKIGEVLEDNFVYEGCKKKYNKDESVNMISAVSFPMAQVIEKNTKIVSIGSRKFFTSVLDLFVKVDSEFVVSKDWKLVSGKTVSC